MKYIVRVTETLARTWVVDADSKQEAEMKVQNAYNDGQINLDYDDYDGCDIDVVRTATDNDCTYYDILEVEE